MKHYLFAAVLICVLVSGAGAQLGGRYEQWIQSRPQPSQPGQSQPLHGPDPSQCAKIPEMERQCDAVKASGSTAGMVNSCKPLARLKAACQSR